MVLLDDMVTSKVVLDRVSDSASDIASRIANTITLVEERLGPQRWTVDTTEPWPTDPAMQTQIVANRPSTAALGIPDPSDGYGLSVAAHHAGSLLHLGVGVGGRFVGRRLPQQNVKADVTNAAGVMVDAGLAQLLFEATVQAWQPLFAKSSSFRIVETQPRRTGWHAPIGYSVWLRDDVARIGTVDDRLTSRPLAGGTLLTATPGAEPEAIVAAFLDTYERNGIDVIPHPTP